MAERLQQPIQNAGLKNPKASLQRAEMYRAQLTQSNSAAQVFSLRLNLALELLNGGSSEAALTEFKGVRQYLEGHWKADGKECRSVASPYRAGFASFG
jgi:hypothetical protein